MDVTDEWTTTKSAKRSNKKLDTITSHILIMKIKKKSNLGEFVGMDSVVVKAAELTVSLGGWYDVSLRQWVSHTHALTKLGLHRICILHTVQY